MDDPPTTRSGKKRAAPPATASRGRSRKRPAMAVAQQWPEKLKRYSGTINAYKRWCCRPPGPGPAQVEKEEFASGIIGSQAELEVVVEKLQTVGYVGSKGGPGSRVDHGHPLKTAAEQSSIDFTTHAVAMAIFPNRVHRPTVLDATPVDDVLQVSCGSCGRNMGAYPSHHSNKPVGFAAVVVPRAPGGKIWKTKFQFKVLSFNELPEASEEEEGEEEE